MKLRLFIIQSVFTIVCWLELVVAVHYWSCSSLHVPDVVSCTCEVPQVLQCLGSKGQGSDSVFVTISSLLSTLPPDNAVSVLELSLIGSSTIPADSFKGTGLHGLVVSSHGSLQLSQFSFRGLENFLLALGLPFNELDEIPVDPIRLLRGLERLDLSNNAITRVSEEDLVALSDLEEINMANNRISVIDRTCFRNNRKLKKIILDGNSLGTSSMDWNHSPFDDLPVLENFFVENNGFSGVLTTTKLPKNVNLMRLNLAFNNFSRVSRGAFSGLPNLQFLDLSHNNLVVIEDGAFQSCALLEILDLQHNRLKDMSERTFNGLISLAYLYLSDNYLDIIDEGMFKPLMAIRYVSAKDNEISHIHPSAFAEARFLESLDLEGE